MTDAFAPLTVPATSRSAEGATFRLKIISQSNSAAPAFKPLPSAPAEHATHSSVLPKITLQRDGDRVTHIRLECGCGEVVELACAY